MKASPCLHWVVLLVVTLSLGTSGCSRPSETSGPAGAATATTPAQKGGTNPASTGPSLKYTAPAEWVSEQSSSSMRQAQYRLPKVDGDPEDAELAVFHFPGGGGTVQENIDRWVAQFQKPDGTPVAATISKREAHGIPITIVDVNGIYLSGSSAMMGETKPKPNFRMLAAVAETASGPWFFKLTGPVRTIERWAASFHSFLDAIE
jgi:hypothetical protein